MISRGMTRRAAFAMTGAAVVFGPSLGAAQGFGPVTGRYAAAGRNPDGSAYSGTVQITETGGAVSMAWQVGSSSYIGTGLREGRVITVNWGSPHPVVYVVMPDGELHGTWADGQALEKLTPGG